MLICKMLICRGQVLSILRMNTRPGLDIPLSHPHTMHIIYTALYGSEDDCTIGMQTVWARLVAQD